MTLTVKTPIKRVGCRADDRRNGPAQIDIASQDVGGRSRHWVQLNGQNQIRELPRRRDLVWRRRTPISTIEKTRNTQRRLGLLPL
jgi:hypothetical protein